VTNGGRSKNAREDDVVSAVPVGSPASHSEAVGSARLDLLRRSGRCREAKRGVNGVSLLTQLYIVMYIHIIRLYTN
jgi:hypothetical protein